MGNPKTENSICFDYLKALADRAPESKRAAILDTLTVLAMEQFNELPQWYLPVSESKAIKAFTKAA